MHSETIAAVKSERVFKLSLVIVRANNKDEKMVRHKSLDNAMTMLCRLAHSEHGFSAVPVDLRITNTYIGSTIVDVYFKKVPLFKINDQ